MPACPATWKFDFSASAEQWPDVDRVSDPRLLHGMAGELYENCPRLEANDALLTAAAGKFLWLAGTDPEQASALQEAHFWLGMVYASHAGTYDRDNRNADSALTHFITLTSPELRRRAASQALALRLRSARQLASLARYTHLNGRNLGKAGWAGASQRVRCFLSAYPDTAGDEDVRLHLIWLSERARDFIHDYSADSRYDLAGMTILAAELGNALAAPGTPNDRWPTAADLDPADAGNPENCYRRPSPIPGPEMFDFDMTMKEGRGRVQSALDAALPWEHE